MKSAHSAVLKAKGAITNKKTKSNVTKKMSEQPHPDPAVRELQIDVGAMKLALQAFKKEVRLFYLYFVIA